MIYDIFFSYQHDDLSYVEKLVHCLEGRGLKCWYAPRNIMGTYAKSISDAIEHSLVFVLILNSKSAVSQEVLNEVELAHNVSKKSNYAQIQPLCNRLFDWDDSEYNEMMYYIHRIQFTEAYKCQSFEEISDLIFASNPSFLKIKDIRVKSEYKIQQIEDERICIQNNLLNSFDNDVYLKTFAKFESPVVLDIGCGNGQMMLQKNLNFAFYLGVDMNKNQIEKAKGKYHTQDVYFYVDDVESDEFVDNVLSNIKLNGVKKFDIINISMVLLHLKKPEELLKKVKHILSDNGVLIIRDIDDGLNFAFPDPEHWFEKVYEICDHDEQSGNRRTGRQIYNNLIISGFTDIRLEHQGFSSIGMNLDEKEEFFQMYFPFSLENSKIMSKKYPWKKEYKEESAWYEEFYNRIHQQFLKKEFIFSLGFQTYTASI